MRRVHDGLAIIERARGKGIGIDVVLQSIDDLLSTLEIPDFRLND
jgi:hypothetical protein